jgi:hypothetical protein
MQLSELKGVETSHGQGTLNLITGRYFGYKNVSKGLLGESFLPTVPTLFEQLRSQYNIPAHHALIVNGEDRAGEEFYTHSNHPQFGVDYRSTVLSLYWYKLYLYEQQLQEGGQSEKERTVLERKLRELKQRNYRTEGREQTGLVVRFWERWRQFYGECGFVNPRGDVLLTELSLRALKELRPRLLMINYNDPDYVHWGFPSHYTRGISVIDQGIRSIVEWTENDPFYRENTVFVIVPDCGRDSNPFVSVPYQHHFNSRSAREIFALFVGPGIRRNQVVSDRVEQIAVAPTVAAVMGFSTPHAEDRALEQVFL